MQRHQLCQDLVLLLCLRSLRFSAKSDPWVVLLRLQQTEMLMHHLLTCTNVSGESESLHDKRFRDIHAAEMFMFVLS